MVDQEHQGPESFVEHAVPPQIAAPRPFVPGPPRSRRPRA
jgi:hypothetical protein